MATSPSAHGLLHMGVGLFSVLQIRSLSKTNAMHHEGQEVFRLLEQTFADLGTMLDKATGEELETRLRKLLLLQEQTAGYIVQNGLPRADQLSAILHAAMDLEAWVPIKLRAWPSGAPERFPFFAALAFARSSASDAVLLQGSDNQTEEQTIQQLRNEISAEAYALCNDQTLFSLAVLRFPALTGYALLRRGLGGAGSVQVQASGFPMIVYGDEETSWDAGLGEVRRLLTTPSEAPSSESLPLKTLADYEWLVSWAGLDRETFDVHSIREVQKESLLNWIGLPPDYPTALSILSFRQAARLGLADLFAGIFSNEFEVAHYPTVSLKAPVLMANTTVHFKNEYFDTFFNSLKERFHGAFLDKIIASFNSGRVEFYTKHGILSISRSSERFVSTYTKSGTLYFYKVTPWYYKTCDIFVLEAERYSASLGIPSTMTLVARPDESKLVVTIHEDRVELEKLI